MAHVLPLTATNLLPELLVHIFVLKIAVLINTKEVNQNNLRVSRKLQE